MCSAAGFPADETGAFEPAHGLGGLSMKDAAERGERAVETARRMYRRVLAGWAMDVLALRASGLDKPGRRAGLEVHEQRKAA